MTKSRLAVAVTAGVLAIGVAMPASAQTWRWDIGVNGGGAFWSDMLDEDQLGAGTADEVRFEPGWLTGAQLTFWPGTRWGLRANLGYSERPLEVDFEDEGFQTDENNLVDDVNLWSASGDLMIRFAEPGEEWLGSEFLPYIALGIGAKIVNPGGRFVVSGDDSDDAGTPFFAGGNSFLLEKDTKLMGLAALGADWRFTPNLGLRLEIGDRLFDAPIALLATDANGNLVRPEGDEDIGELTHELFGTVGLHWLLGLAERERIAIAPPPPPPGPLPEPEPVEERVTVCVIDPTAESGFRIVDAVFLPERGDTLVVTNGSRIPLDQSIGTVTVASTADWYIAGSPLRVRVGGTDAEFITVMGPRQIESRDLTFIGTVNGLPVYASRTDVVGFESDLVEVRTRLDRNELEDIFEEDVDLRSDFDELDVVYVPLRPTGCVFQAVQRVEEVRKTRGQ